MAHLAGGLGLAVLLLVPWNPDWRWMRDRTDSPWYPGTKIFRQSGPERWHDVVAQVTDYLERLAKCR
jgi:hypothetical protein